MNEHHVLPLRVYLGVFLGLLVLTGLTTGVAHFDVGILNTPLALAIAIAKALLVLLYFMHVRFSTTLVRLWALAGFGWLVILFVFLLTDYLARLPIRGWEG